MSKSSKQMKEVVVGGFQPVLYEEINPRRNVVKLSELPYEMQPVPRLVYSGAVSLNTAELLAVILRTGTGTENAIDLAERLLIEFDGLAGISHASIEQLTAVHGISEAKASAIKAALELGRRLLASSPQQRPQVRNPTDVANLLLLEMGLLDHEELRVVLVDTKSYMIKIHMVYSGSLNSAVVRIGEVFKEAIRCNAMGMILTHNHPSGDPTPSPEDARVTEMIVEAGKLLDIDVMDHLIIGRNRFVSLKERCLGFK